MINYLKYFLPGTNRTPIYLIQFVTSKCMGRCLHCFYWKEINRPENPLDPSEVYRIASGMGPVLQWLVTGGEPYLRDDFDEVVRAFYRARKPYNIAVATSGYFPDRTVKSAETLLKDCPRSNFIFGLPVEGVGEENDRIRGVKGFFDRTTTAIRKLKDLKQSLKRSQSGRLTILVDITLSGLNRDTIEETYRFVRDEIEPDVVNVILVRGDVRDQAAAGPDIEVFRRINAMLDNDLRSGKLRGYGRYARLVNAKDALLREVTADTFEGKGRYYPCAAGNLVGVITPDGDLGPCELLPDTFGNLREADYNVEALWTSQAARDFRRRIRAERCRCTHQCFLSPTIFFHPLGAAEIGLELIRSAAGRGKSGVGVV